ncbi:hypothetical protein N7450_011678 [Penicillium hetheringtonii]|uniref:Uncharacterized protein n=1 Tax=Penicillium hetheringtonii TaxID=911720 RepID=A0AAD6DC28_9EURO|nr:hypothetical protein N7450_011678 [Penicillium hetheringtonii]
MPFVRNSLGIRELMAQAFKSDKQLKVLVTGNSSCGKTTFIRKIRLRMGDSISDMEKEALKIVVYSEFIALVKSHRHELRCKAHSIQSAEKCVPNFWSQVDGCAPSQWCQEVREALQKISEDPSVWQTMEERLPKHSYLRKSYSADIFGEKWLPLDADVIQSHVTSSGTESTIVDSRIAFIEENLDTLRSNYVKNVGADVKLVVLLVGLTGSEPDESQFSVGSAIL